MIKKFFCSISTVVLASHLLLVSVSHANGLKDILKYTLTSAPEIKEASANIDASRNRTEQAKAQHLPVISLTGSQVLAQRHSSASDYTSKSLIPGIEGQVNLYSFGAIQTDVERTQKEEEFYQQKYISTQEDLAYTVSKMYLEALSMKESIAIMNKSLERHRKILGDIGVITANDEGRESEYVQAEARMLMVEQEINRYRKRLSSLLNTLSKYSDFPLTEKSLFNPFKDLTDDVLYSKYTLANKTSNPSYQAQVADLAAKELAVKVEDKKQMPKINIIGSATKDDRLIGLKMSWDILNRPSGYSVREKASQMAAAYEKLQQISRDIEEFANLAKININESRVQLKTLKSQIDASSKVLDFYKLQFDIARRTLLDVLNAEKELSTIELTYTNTQNDLRMAMLDYLYSQGMISTWSGLKSANVINAK